RREPDPEGKRKPLEDVLQPGYKQLAAGYVVYGSSTMLVYTTGHGVYGFTLDPSIGAYLISHERITMPKRGTIYSVNEAYADNFAEPYRRFLAHPRPRATGRRHFSRFLRSLGGPLPPPPPPGGLFPLP